MGYAFSGTWDVDKHRNPPMFLFGRCQQSLFLLFYLSISDNSYGRDLGIQLSPQGFDLR